LVAANTICAMNYDLPERLDVLAAHYVLGTLSPRARRRLAKLARSDRRIQDAIQQWEERLQPLAEAVPPVTPPERVWKAILARIGRNDSDAIAPAPSVWANLGLWRGLTLAGFATAFALAVVVFGAHPEAPADPIVAVLAGQDARPALIASADRSGRFLTVKAVGAQPPAAGRSWELWALPNQGNPRSLGLVSPTGVARIPLPGPAGMVLQDVKGLAISVEASGGSTTGQPQGPVVYTGPIQQLY
jgi:anti-sigma-K factor RskA